jgi:DNA-binding beta-propeller fold protein YncE
VPVHSSHIEDVNNAAKCNAKVASDCRVAARARVGHGPLAVAVDEKTDTIYVANGTPKSAGTVSVLNGARCNARTASGCGRTPPTVTTGAQAAFATVDHALHTVFAINQGDDTLSAVNTRTCNGTLRSGCQKRPPSEQATFSPRHGFNPNAFALIPQTGTAYRAAPDDAWLELHRLALVDAIGGTARSRPCESGNPRLPGMHGPPALM